MMVLIIKYTVMSSVVLLMLGVGMRTELREVVGVAKKVRLVSVGLLVSFVVTPILMFLCIRWFPVSIDVKIGIMLMAAAPIAPMAPPFVGMAKGDVPYSVGLMTIVAVLSVALTPLILAVALPATEGGLNLDTADIVRTLLTVQLIPIGIGMAIHRSSATLSGRLLTFVPKVGQIGLLTGVAAVLVLRAEQILSIGVMGFALNIAVVVLCLVVGHVAHVGEASDKKRSLAISNAIRNIPLAFLIANTTYPGTAVGGVTLVFATFSMIASVIYGRLMTRRAAAETTLQPVG